MGGASVGSVYTYSAYHLTYGLTDCSWKDLLDHVCNHHNNGHRFSDYRSIHAFDCAYPGDGQKEGLVCEYIPPSWVVSSDALIPFIIGRAISAF